MRYATPDTFGRTILLCDTRHRILFRLILASLPSLHTPPHIVPIPCADPQVYKAVLRDTGEEVAVKVQRPGVEPTILRDLLIFRWVHGGGVRAGAGRRSSGEQRHAGHDGLVRSGATLFPCGP